MTRALLAIGERGNLAPRAGRGRIAKRAGRGLAAV